MSKLYNASNTLRTLSGSSNCRTAIIIIIIIIVIIIIIIIAECCILIRAHDQNTVIKQRIGKFLRPRDKNNGSLSWFIQFNTYLSRVYYMPSTILGVSDTDVINKEKNLRGVAEYLSGVGSPYFICNSPCFRELNWHSSNDQMSDRLHQGSLFNISVNINLVQSFFKKQSFSKQVWMILSKEKEVLLTHRRKTW